MNVTRTSILSGKTSTLFIPDLTQSMVDSWTEGELIQIALAGIPQELREFVMTGITPQEWSERLPTDDENIDDDYAATAEAQHESWGDQWLE